MLLAFGLPVFLLPEKMKGEDKWAEFYNKTLGTSTYKEKVKPVVDKALGGALRLLYRKYMKEVILRVMKKWCFMPMPICRMGVRWSR